MESSALERIFDPYFTSKEPTGLELAVVHGIVKSHGGAIKVSIDVGNGTRFTVFLPRAMGFEKVADVPLHHLPGEPRRYSLRNCLRQHSR